jgi:hypothetical protein
MLNPQLGMPGIRAAVTTTTREIFWGGDASRQKILRGQGTFSNTLRDAGGDPTTQIRPGLLLGALTSDSKLVHWNPAATDGSEILPGQPDCLSYHQFRLFGLAHYRACCKAGREPIFDFSGYKTEKHNVFMLIIRLTGNAAIAAQDLREAGYPDLVHLLGD